MKKLLLTVSCLSLIFMVGCKADNNDYQASDGNTSDNQVTTDIEDILDDTEQIKVLEMIGEFKDSLILLGATETDPNLYTPRFLSNVTYSMITKQDVIEMPVSSSMDFEWLDMSMMVLDFSEELANSEYVLGEETLLSDIIVDSSMWGWEINDTTKVILEDREEVLYLRVISDQTIRTFYFSYDENHYMNILRMDEAGTLYNKSIYIEDFTEKTGLSIWTTDFSLENNNNLQVYTTYHVNENSSIVLLINSLGEPSFQMATYLLGDIPVTVSFGEEGTLYLQYDLALMDNYDSFDLDGNLYLDGELVTSPLTIYAGPFYIKNTKNYIVYGRKTISTDEESIAISEWGLNSEITYADIIADIALAKSEYTITGVQYDYTLDTATIIGLLQDELYFDYSAELD